MQFSLEQLVIFLVISLFVMAVGRVFNKKYVSFVGTIGIIYIGLELIVRYVL